jgi:hypothetical protein
MNKHKDSDATELLAALATEMPGVEIKRSDAATSLEFQDESAAEQFITQTVNQIPLLKYLKVRQEGAKVTISVPPLVRSIIKRKGSASIGDYLPLRVID